MNFQHLILPAILWLLVGWGVFFLVPSSPLIVGGLVVLIAVSVFFSMRLITHGRLAVIVSLGIAVFLFSSALSGFNLINLLLITAIGTLISLLTPTKG